jgi:putative SOS response-associated peptidase YedK
MCGRYTLRTPQGVLVEHFRVNSLPDYVPRYNVAPTQQVGVVRQIGPNQRQLSWMQWGLIPFWAKNPQDRQPDD